MLCLSDAYNIKITYNLIISDDRTVKLKRRWLFRRIWKTPYAYYSISIYILLWIYKPLRSYRHSVILENNIRFIFHINVSFRIIWNNDTQVKYCIAGRSINISVETNATFNIGLLFYFNWNDVNFRHKSSGISLRYIHTL